MASSVTGAVVGTFKVGMGVKVGPPIFRPDKPKILLKGKTFITTVISGAVYQVQPPKARMTVRAKVYGLIVNGGPILGSSRITLKGKPGLRLVTPDKAVVAKARLTLRGKHYNRVSSYTMQPGKPKVILRGQKMGKIGSAGMVPTVPVSILLAPSPAVDEGQLVPSPAYTGLLVPTVEEFV